MATTRYAGQLTLFEVNGRAFKCSKSTSDFKTDLCVCGGILPYRQVDKTLARPISAFFFP